MEDRKTDARWVPCPICGGKTGIRIYQDTVLIKFPLYCRKCRRETKIDVVQFKMVLSNKPDA